jgi:hypothetical protein
MALISVSDVEARTGETYTGTELARVNAFIDDISALVELYARKTWAPTPAAIKAVVANEVRYYLNIEPGVASEQVDILRTSYANTGQVQDLSDSAKATIDEFLKMEMGIPRRGGIGTIQLISTWKPEEP